MATARTTHHFDVFMFFWLRGYLQGDNDKEVGIGLQNGGDEKVDS